MVAVLNILGRLPQAWTRILLKSVKGIFKVFTKLHRFGEGEDYIAAILRDIPNDMRTVQKRLQLEPPTSTTYACCPSKACSKIYAQKADGTWPDECTNILKGKSCGEAMLRNRSSESSANSQEKRFPIRPFVLFDIKSQVAEMLSAEPTSTLLWKKGLPAESVDPMTDILHGNMVRNFEGPTIGPKGTNKFFDAADNEARLLFTLSVDWANPFGNKAAGVVASVGVIALCCINLPISIRYKPENLILAGIIPGPHEPGVESINYFLQPIVDDFKILWKQGISLISQDTGISARRMARAAIISVVADLPAAKKISGTLSHKADAFCTMCTTKKDNMSNLDISSWSRRTKEEHREACYKWLNAKPEERKKLEKASGIRYSALIELGYHDPSRHTAVDVMHNIFLGITKRHFIEVLGIADGVVHKGGIHLYKQPVEKSMRTGRKILNSRERISKRGALVDACTWADLYALTIECEVHAQLNPIRKENSKDSMAELLNTWVSRLLPSKNSC